MANTYLATLDTDKDKVRFETSDTNMDDVFLSDEEIEYILTTEGSLNAAVKKALYIIYMKLSRKADVEIDGAYKIKYSSMANTYKNMYDTAVNTSGSVYGGSVVGLITQTQVNDYIDSLKAIDAKLGPRFTKDTLTM